jgi:hypothetical protein
MQNPLGAPLTLVIGTVSIGCSDSDAGCSARFVACADGLTVEDNATGLLWERKTGTRHGPPDRN